MVRSSHPRMPVRMARPESGLAMEPKMGFVTTRVQSVTMADSVRLRIRNSSFMMVGSIDVSFNL